MSVGKTSSRHGGDWQPEERKKLLHRHCGARSDSTDPTPFELFENQWNIHLSIKYQELGEDECTARYKVKIADDPNFSSLQQN